MVYRIQNDEAVFGSRFRDVVHTGTCARSFLLELARLSLKGQVVSTLSDGITPLLKKEQTNQWRTLKQEDGTQRNLANKRVLKQGPLFLSFKS